MISLLKPPSLSPHKLSKVNQSDCIQLNQKISVSNNRQYIHMDLFIHSYNAVLDITLNHCWTPVGHLKLFLLYVYAFYSPYIMDWIANADIGLDHNNSVIKRLRCTCLRTTCQGSFGPMASCSQTGICIKTLNGFHLY